MGGVLVLNQIDDTVCGLPIEQARDFFAEAPVLMPIKGVTPYAGESWRAYGQRVEALLDQRSSATAPAPSSPARPGAVCILAALLAAAVLILTLMVAL